MREQQLHRYVACGRSPQGRFEGVKVDAIAVNRAIAEKLYTNGLFGAIDHIDQAWKIPERFIGQLAAGAENRGDRNRDIRLTENYLGGERVALFR